MMILRVWHDLDFGDLKAPLGYGRCRRCGQIVSRDLWAAQRCLGPTRKEERTP